MLKVGEPLRSKLAGLRTRGRCSISWPATFRSLAPIAHIAGMDAIKALGLFVVTTIAEIVGCYLPYLWLK